MSVQLAIENSMKADLGLQSVLGNPMRLYDAPVKHAAFPFAVWRRWEAKPIAGDYENAVENIATLEIVCRNTGIDEAKKAIQKVQEWAINAKIQTPEVSIPLIMTAYADVYRAIDGRSFLGVVRLKIISQITGV